MPLLMTFDPDVSDADLRVILRAARDELGRLGGVVLASPDGTRYLSGWGVMRLFGLDTEVEDPRTFAQVKSFRRAVAAYRAQPVRDPHVIGGVWVCPDSGYEPNDKYMAMTGGRFPGCPTQ